MKERWGGLPRSAASCRAVSGKPSHQPACAACRELQLAPRQGPDTETVGRGTWKEEQAIAGRFRRSRGSPGSRSSALGFTDGVHGCLQKGTPPGTLNPMCQPRPLRGQPVTIPQTNKVQQIQRPAPSATSIRLIPSHAGTLTHILLVNPSPPQHSTGTQGSG